MIYLIALMFATSIGLILVALAQLIPARSGAIGRRLSELEQAGESPFGTLQRRDRQARREKWEAILQQLGERTSDPDSAETGELRRRMVHAGFQNPNAASIYTGLRIVLPLSVALLGFLFMPSAGGFGMLLTISAAALAWVAPSFWLDRRIGKRQREIQKALADALDMLVTCVEAGLGINQAILRVAEEIRYISTILSQELMIVNLEIRAGRPREEALRGFADRTGVEDVRELTTMLIQTDRFGTSVAQALRVHSDTLRTKRRQRAEEAAAKTAIKILFPVLFCIFPGLFVVIIGPGAIQIYENLVKGGLGG
jgi:tight adherence protein C